MAVDQVSGIVYVSDFSSDYVVQLTDGIATGPPGTPPPSGTPPPTPVAGQCNFSHSAGTVTADCDGTESGFDPGTLELASPLGFDITSSDSFANYVGAATASFSSSGDTGCPAHEGCFSASLAFPSPFTATAGDAACPTPAGQANAGLDYCVAVVEGTGSYTGDAAVDPVALSGQSLPATPTLTTDLGSYVPGETITLGGEISGDASQYFQSVDGHGSVTPAPAGCGAPGYGNVDPSLVSAGFVPVGGGSSDVIPASGAAVSNACYDPTATTPLSPPAISGTLTVPSTPGNYDAFVCEAEFDNTLFPPNDNEGLCGGSSALPAGATGWLIAETEITVNDVAGADAGCSGAPASGPPGTNVEITCPADAGSGVGAPAVSIPGLTGDPTGSCGSVSQTTGLVTCTIPIPSGTAPQLQEIEMTQTTPNVTGGTIEEGYTFQITASPSFGTPTSGTPPTDLSTSCTIPTAPTGSASSACSIYQLYSVSVAENDSSPITLSEPTAYADLETETPTGCNGGAVVPSGNYVSACGVMPEVTLTDSSGSQDGVVVSVSMAHPDFYNTSLGGNTGANEIPIGPSGAGNQGLGFRLGISGATGNSGFYLGASGSAPQSDNGYGPYVASASNSLSDASGTTGLIAFDSGDTGTTQTLGDGFQDTLCSAAAGGAEGTTICGSGVSLVVPPYVTAGDYWNVMTIMATVTG
jgi:hypothetical protein